MTCIRIHEPSDRQGTWHDNYFCYASAPGIQGIGMKWSSKGNIICVFFSRYSDTFFGGPLKTTVLKVRVSIIIKMTESLTVNPEREQGTRKKQTI